MDPEEFRKYGKEMVDYLADFVKSEADGKVLPNVEPGYMRPLIPEYAPDQPEPFSNIMADLDKVIMPGVTHWHHPNFHAYYPTARSFPALLGDMLSGTIACIGFTWIASPACTELEIITLDWLVHALDLPSHFLSTSEKGGGVIQGTASEASLIALLAARSKVIREKKRENPNVKITDILHKMVAYGSDQSHSSIERACQIALVNQRTLPTDFQHSLRGETLQKAIEEDREKELIPLICFATMGTTCSCAFDNLEEIGQVCKKEDIWCHTDAAYAGSSLLCEEFRYLAKGVDLMTSFNFNCHKWMNVTFDCSALWLKDKDDIVEAFNVDPIYLKHDFTGIPDYRHWQIPLGRRFRSLKLWFVMRTYGISGLQKRIRQDVRLAHEFEDLLEENEHFEIVAPVTLGLVCFRVKDSNTRTQKLYELIKEDKRIHLVPSIFPDTDTYFIRFTICSSECSSKHIIFAYDVIKELSQSM